MRAQRSRRGPALRWALLGLTLADCAPLIGLDEDYYVAARGGAGQGGSLPPGGSTTVAGGGSAGITMTADCESLFPTERRKPARN